jgi:hypothetical protein
MKILTLTTALLALSCCSHPAPKGNQESRAAEPPAGAVSPAAAAPQGSRPTERTATAKGEPYALHLAGGTLTFCDQRGMRNLDLSTGEERAGTEPCPQPKDSNTGCEGLPFDADVRSPHGEADDVVDVIGVHSYPVKGRVHDCVADGKALAISTGSVVEIIDTASNARTEIFDHGADRVALGNGWIAWADGSNIRAKPVTDH